jgi:antitoxin component YwqK of YwqJK toxin-antitoxin module
MQFKPHTLVSLAGIVVSILAGGARAQDDTTDSVPAADICFIAKADTLPNAAVAAAGDVTRIKPLLAAIPDGYRIRLEFTTISKGITGYKDDLRYAHRMTSVDADGKPDGLEIEYLDWYRAASRKTQFKKGVRDGVEQLFFPPTDKLQMEIPWANGKIHGVKKTLHATGTVAGETTYDQGTLVGESRAYTEKGALLRVVRYANGQRDGEMIDYWPDTAGIVERMVPYKKGLVDGVSKAYYADGKPKRELRFRKNKQHGIERQFAPDGSVEKERFWIDGDTVTAEEFKTTFKE